MKSNTTKTLNLIFEYCRNEIFRSLLQSFYKESDLNDSDNQILLNNLKNALIESHGLGNDYNLIPCPSCKSGCRELLIGFAELGFESKSSIKNKHGFRSLMAQLYPYWFNCSDNNINFIFTSNFDRNKFNEFYLPTFVAFQNLKRKVYVIEVAKDGLYLQYEN